MIQDHDRRRVFWLSSLLCYSIAATMLIGVLAVQNHRLKTPRSRPSPTRIRNAAFRPFRYLSVNTGSVGMFREPKRALLLIYRPDCATCRKLAPDWSGLVHRPSSVTVLSVSMGEAQPTRDFVSYYGVPSSVRPADREEASKLEVTAVPETILLEGMQVKDSWVGMLDNAAKKRIEEFLN
jgi:hypothetical protein